MSVIVRESPFVTFTEWYEAARQTEPSDPNAMALATADEAGRPSLRMVLMKDYDERGIVFYTNSESRKGGELLSNPRAALLFHWKSQRRQIRMEGVVEPVSAEEADAYFQSRDRASRIGAWASQQSRPLEGRFELERRVAEYTAKFGLGAVPRPDYWSGFRVLVERVEFWQEGKFRLHERLIYERGASGWSTHRLYP
jgi:pyridoxamine 5'-phosphate oxidase